MKYALLAYDLDGSLEQLAGEAKRALHRRQGELHEHTPITRSANVITHYRFRPAPITTIRHDPDTGTAIRSDIAASEASAALRALYIIESDDPDAVAQLAEQLPATLQGATIEIWPLTEPRASH